jgi:hypothetical protein
LQKYGFVYIWRDRKHNRYYIGCHWGDENDKYICSSEWMKKAYKKRPQDFKRRILKTNINERSFLFEEEYKWLSLIKKEELDKKYYNIHNWIYPINGFGKTEEDRKAAKKKGYIAAKMKENCKENSKKGNKRLKELLETDPVFREKFRKKVKETCYKNVDKLNTEEAIKKKKEIFKKIGHQQGEKNSSFGTFWITDGLVNRKWKNSLGNLPEMFYKGRTYKRR